ncbi:hypothetical protein LQ953_07235 [Sphingomonas sp. IC-56]|uniref:hypothetical protein n=1 Tax=Sphingomonas sp. IC-56 TaxID=2898529 RepID=UPI001E5092DC|nr:hypothetical protein [Sphingomonas sp. IC-56]MCD2323807.1 hypothetical protein [Sphingomonas sp. IC-56]
MIEFLIFMYAMLGMFVVMAMQRNQRQQRPTPQMMTMVGWGLFSLSSTLAMLLGAVAIAMALGLQPQLPAGFDAPLF